MKTINPDSFIQFQAVNSVRSGSAKPSCQQVQHFLESEEAICGFGQPMTNEFLRDRIWAYIIRRYLETGAHCHLKSKIEDLFKRLDNPDFISIKDSIIELIQEMLMRVLDEPFAITLGKESLLLLLSQKECEGIRFYFCLNPNGERSIAAVGVKTMRDKSGKIIEENGKEIPQDIGILDDSASLARAENYNDFILNDEVGPPSRLYDLFRGILRNQISMTSKDTSIFIQELSEVVREKVPVDLLSNQDFIDLLTEYEKTLK
jgi:hypothetical protein